MNSRRIITLLLCICFVGSISARGFKYRKNYVAVGGSAGYSLIDYSSNNPTSGRAGSGVALGLAWKAESEWYFTLLGEMSYLSSQMYKNPQMLSKRAMLDTDNVLYYKMPGATDPTTGNEYFDMYTYFDKFKETGHLFYANVHPSISYRFFNGQYVSVGAKFGYNIRANSRSKTLATNKGVYPQYIGVFEDMPEHYLMVDKKVTASNPWTVNYNISGTLEYGYEVVSGVKGKEDHMLRIGAFLDYGLVDINNNSKTSYPISYSTLDGASTLSNPVYVHKDDPSDFDLVSVVNASTFDGPLTTIFSGVRITYYYCYKKVCSCKKRSKPIKRKGSRSYKPRRR